jgi:hypothetical protein
VALQSLEISLGVAPLSGNGPAPALGQPAHCTELHRVCSPVHAALRSQLVEAQQAEQLLVKLVGDCTIPHVVGEEEAEPVLPAAPLAGIAARQLPARRLAG